MAKQVETAQFFPAAAGELGPVAGTGRPGPGRATNYVLGVVLFAVGLFFAGMSTKLRAPALRKGLLALGSLLFLATVAWIATFPVNVSV